MLVKRTAQQAQLAAFIVANFRRDLAGKSLVWWDTEYLAVRSLRGQV